MKFTIIDSRGYACTVEAEDIVEAIESCWNNHTGLRHIVAAALVEDGE